MFIYYQPKCKLMLTEKNNNRNLILSNQNKKIVLSKR